MLCVGVLGEALTFGILNLFDYCLQMVKMESRCRLVHSPAFAVLLIWQAGCAANGIVGTDVFFAGVKPKHTLISLSEQ